MDSSLRCGFDDVSRSPLKQGKEEAVGKHNAVAVDIAKSVFEVAVSKVPGRVAERRRLYRAAQQTRPHRMGGVEARPPLPVRVGSVEGKSPRIRPPRRCTSESPDGETGRTGKQEADNKRGPERPPSSIGSRLRAFHHGPEPTRLHPRGRRYVCSPDLPAVPCPPRRRCRPCLRFNAERRAR